MNYPIWELTGMSGASLIALIAVLHVYIAHLAVGGGIFIWLTDWKGFRENSPDIHEYVRRHTWFFLLLTMVFGGISGVGIWFIIALVSPAATSTLIHNFVFGWAIEWVFFLGEIVALLVYHYRFSVMSRKHRLRVAFLYALFAWLSLFIINGILSFMLTPGRWLETGNFWDGFLNPTFLPSLIFRTAFAIMIAGLFGYVTSVFLKDNRLRTRMMRYCGKWLLLPLILFIPAGIWYYHAVPGANRLTNFQLNPETFPYQVIFIAATVVIFLFGLFFMLRLNRGLQKVLTFILVLIGLCWFGGFEYMREFARKPYIISDYVYSNSIYASDAARLNREGVLKNAKWVTHREITAANKLEAGKELFRLECNGCHTGNGHRGVAERSQDLTYMGMFAQLEGQGKVQTYMPRFIGNREEMSALAAYIVSELNHKEILTEPEPYHIDALPPAEKQFDPKKDEYVLLVWNDLGMHCISDSDPWFVILPPANTLEAQLIKRGETPEIITEGVELIYKVEDGFEHPEEHVKFWDYASIIFGADLKKGIGLFGNGLTGKFGINPENGSFSAAAIPVIPYRDDGSFNPYPLFTVEARDSARGQVLMSTQVVAPTSTEMGCRNCHAGGWSYRGIAGVSDTTAINILKAHDRLSGTTLYKEALEGKPRLCAGCHGDPALGVSGDSSLLYLSQAIHGWHANYMPYEGGVPCVMCHPALSRGRTRCSRGIHGAFGMSCDKCHGSLDDHAASLLKGQIDRKGASRLLANLNPKYASSIDDVNPRMPWVKEPDCLTCHVDFQQPENTSMLTGFNVWNEEFGELYRMRTDDAGVRCEACHGSTHALYPALNPFEKNRDNIQTLQYGKKPYPIGSDENCAVCHTIKMEFPVHHENMLRMFRNVETVAEKRQ